MQHGARWGLVVAQGWRLQSDPRVGGGIHAEPIPPAMLSQGLGTVATYCCQALGLPHCPHHRPHLNSDCRAFFSPQCSLGFCCSIFNCSSHFRPPPPTAYWPNSAPPSQPLLDVLLPQSFTDLSPAETFCNDQETWWHWDLGGKDKSWVGAALHLLALGLSWKWAVLGWKWAGN